MSKQIDMPNTKLDKGLPSIPEYTKPNGQSIRYGSSLMMNCIGLGVMLNMFRLLIAIVFFDYLFIPPVLSIVSSVSISFAFP